MAGNDATALPFKPGRRNFLYSATAAMGAAGVVAAAWPFLDQMNPDAGTRANSDIVEIDATDLHPAEQRIAKWRQMPVFILRRTPEMLATMVRPAFVATLVDPQSDRRQQPDYARNGHRSIDPAYGVLVGICTRCGCVPQYRTEDAGYVCPCCASHYDAAGRAQGGVAPYNLPVPPYSMAGASRILIGKNPSGSLFSFTSIERI